MFVYKYSYLRKFVIETPALIQPRLQITNRLHGHFKLFKVCDIIYSRLGPGRNRRDRSYSLSTYELRSLKISNCSLIASLLCNPLIVLV